MRGQGTKSTAHKRTCQVAPEVSCGPRSKRVTETPSDANDFDNATPAIPPPTIAARMLPRKRLITFAEKQKQGTQMLKRLTRSVKKKKKVVGAQGWSH
jgi:hypothetical protein